MPHDRLIALEFIRRDPSHQPVPFSPFWIKEEPDPFATVYHDFILIVTYTNANQELGYF